MSANKKTKNGVTDEEIKTFIDSSYKEYCIEDQTDETLFSIIGGKSTDERTATRILRFFFDTNGKHNMNDLFIRSFLEAAGENYNEFPKTFSAKKEVMTKKGKLIDILLTNQECNIVIENKIYADLYNDLNEYYKTASDSGESWTAPKKVEGYVLSLFDLQDSIDDMNLNKKFKCVTYKNFLDELQKNLGTREYNFSKNNKYYILCNDFIENMKSLEEENKMEETDIEFWNKYKKVYSTLNEKRVKLLKQRIDRLKKALEQKFGDDCKFSVWNINNFTTADCDKEDAFEVNIYSDLKFENDSNITIQPNIEISLLKGIKIGFEIKGNSQSKSYKNLQIKLENKKCDFKKYERLRYYIKKFDINEPTVSIAQATYNIYRELQN